MKADKMFEAIGYARIYGTSIDTEGEIAYCITNEKIRSATFIYFISQLKSYQKRYWGELERYNPPTITVKEHQAIHQQLIELGWIESQGIGALETSRALESEETK